MTKQTIQTLIDKAAKGMGCSTALHGALRPHTPAPTLRHKVSGPGPRCLSGMKRSHWVNAERT